MPQQVVSPLPVSNTPPASRGHTPTLCLQLIPLCIRHRLFAALIHIFTRALQDHQTPAALLLVAAAAAAEAEAQAATAEGADGQAGAAALQADTGVGEAAALLSARDSLRLGYKLLVYLRCCLLGRNYPPGMRGGWGGDAIGSVDWLQLPGLAVLSRHFISADHKLAQLAELGSSRVGPASNSMDGVVPWTTLELHDMHDS